ncbi:MAG: hypothetical protein C4297_06925 [Gemmataceae bacterium]
MTVAPWLLLETLLLCAGLGVWCAWQGAFRALLVCVHLVLAGLIAFNFAEPIAAGLASLGGDMEYLADGLVYGVLFLGALAALVGMAMLLIQEEPSLAPTADRVTGAVAGAVAGYLLAGILGAVYQTLPGASSAWCSAPQGPVQPWMPDRVWLGLVRHASEEVFDYLDPNPFDPDRYLRYYWDRTGRGSPVERPAQ